MARSATADGIWAQEAHDLARGIAGGLLFGVPLLYTMEVWWLGGTTSPPRMLVILGVTLVPVTLLIHSAGFKHRDEARIVDSVIDAMEALALGLVIAAVVLVLLHEIGPDTPAVEAVGKVVHEAAPFAVGAAVASHVFANARGDNAKSSRRRSDRSGLQDTASDMGATLIGSLFVAFNIAPTEEVPMLATASTGPSLLGMIALSLAASYAIVYVAGFGDQQRRREQKGIFQHPVTETVVSYILALISAGFMLWFFRNLSAPASWSTALSEIVVLGLPAAVGGAAGRLAA